MSALPPDDADPTDRERSAAQIDAEFAAIISGISPHMSWDTGSAPDTATADAGQTRAGRLDEQAKADVGEADGLAAAQERERRRAMRRAQRAEEVAEFEAGQAAAAAEMQADDSHFVPPEPPPVPLPKRRTLVALLLMAVGLVMLIRPSLLQVAPDGVLVLGIGFVVGGFGMLVYGLRPHASDADDADGWDDGARL